MTEQENERNWRRYEESHSDRPDSPELAGVVDELKIARISGNKELQEKIEKGEHKRFYPTECNDGGKLTKKREREINQSWRNAEKANKEWEESLKARTP